VRTLTRFGLRRYFVALQAQPVVHSQRSQSHWSPQGQGPALRCARLEEDLLQGHWL
jgi:hypothetical protein